MTVHTIAPVQDEPEDPDLPERFPRINWAEAFATDFTEIDWLPGRFIERGQQMALVGDGKVGKTLFAHNWIYCAITGRSFLGDIRREPIRVLYFDRENSLRDIVTRMMAFGATPDDLARLDYRLFPRFSGALDASASAAAELLAIVEDNPCDVVVLDTVSRFISGKENDSDTWLNLYGRIHAPLKARGVAGVRLDHMGKDTERGARGSSAKAQDVDHVWELTITGEERVTRDDVETITTRLKFARTHTRTGLGDDVFHIVRRGERERGGMWLAGRTRHELADAQDVQNHQLLVQTYVDELITRGAPTGVGRDRLIEWAKQNDVPLPGKTAMIADVVRAFKAQS